MIKHILNRVWNERRVNFWITLELLLISVCMWFVVDFLSVKIYSYHQPLGFDITHTYRLNLNGYESSSYLYKKDAKSANYYLHALIDRIKQDSTVEAVCITRSLAHYEAVSSTVPISTISNDTVYDKTAWTCAVTSDYFKVFRVKSKLDNSWESLSEALLAGGVVVTPATEQLLTKDNSAIGTMFYKGREGSLGMPIKDVCTTFRPHEFSAPTASFYELIRLEEIIFGEYNLQYLYLYIRVKPLADGVTYAHDFQLRMQEFLSLGNVYLDRVTPIQSYRKSMLKKPMDELQTGMIIAFFFMINIFLGILGTFWFRTRQRKAELGLRVALGSNRMQLRTLLIGEGIILLTMAFIPSIVLSFNIGYAELIDVYLMPFNGLRFVIGLSITYLLLAITIVLGIWIPAQQAIKISPTEALHNT